ncbi:MAG TPA: hypothetical protein VG406_13785 [Isosphaeraceae bacterium]|nr:hypothetical protein [Isosphaeraceae bacterium]
MKRSLINVSLIVAAIAVVTFLIYRSWQITEDRAREASEIQLEAGLGSGTVSTNGPTPKK